jgi:hypothetical protein
VVPRPQVPLAQIPAATGAQLDIELTVTADFTKAGVAAGVSVLGGTPITIASLPASDPKNPEGIDAGR